jgi:hypothetical protein
MLSSAIYHTITSRLSRSLAKSSNQDWYPSMLSVELFTSCGLSIRHGSPRCSTDSTAAAQSPRVIKPAGESWPVDLSPRSLAHAPAFLITYSYLYSLQMIETKGIVTIFVGHGRVYWKLTLPDTIQDCQLNLKFRQTKKYKCAKYGIKSICCLSIIQI